jgi:hypothetical protein
MTGPPPIPQSLPSEARERVEALDSRACPKCGGKAEWEPRQQALVCPYCGFVLDARNAAADEVAVVREHDLRHALATLEEASRGIERGQRKVHCQHCNADSLVPTDTVADRCQFCGSPEIVAYDAIESAIRPESLLPKQIDRPRAYETMKKWASGRFWAPGDLKRKNLVENVKGIYLPYWTFDAFARCPWEAESGTYYWDTEHYTDAQGRRQTRQVRKTRWSPASGEVRFQFDDITIPATRLVPREELEAVEPFPTKELVPYDTVYVAGWTVEHYQVTLRDGAGQAVAVMQAVLRNLAASDVPGDTYRNLRIAPEYSNETFKHILVPVWLLIYQYRGKMFRTIVNGYTGTITGSYPVSAWKVAIAVLIGLAVVALVALIAGGAR